MEKIEKTILEICKTGQVPKQLSNDINRIKQLDSEIAGNYILKGLTKFMFRYERTSGQHQQKAVSRFAQQAVLAEKEPSKSEER